VASSIAASILLLTLGTANCAEETWEQLDRHLKQQVLQLNVGLKLKLKNGMWAQLSDLSPKYHYPVFSTTRDDKGYRVVGFGSTFPVSVNDRTRTYYITNRHVVESGKDVASECERFYAALRLYAEQTGGHDADARYTELLQTVNLSAKKDLSLAERTLYQTTVDAIWDCYETYLSDRVDPARALFRKYLAAAGVQPSVSYFLHRPGPVTQPAIEAQLYKSAKSDAEPDLAILATTVSMPGMEFDSVEPSEGQEIQVIGYPTASDQIDVDSSKYYAPTFNTGRISRVAPRILQVDAPITTGNSGGPVVSVRGKVVGVVAVRAISARGGELPNFGGAVTVQSVKSFAPELF
jgi:S1-C subfamily serine protease